MSKRRLRTTALLIALGTIAAGTANAAPDATSEGVRAEASIPFVHLGSIRDWQADQRKGLWIQDSRRNWFYAKTMGTCTGLNFATNIGFDTRSSSTFDRFSAIVVPREGRCQIQSLTRSDAPPKKANQAQVEAEAST